MAAALKTIMYTGIVTMLLAGGLPIPQELLAAHAGLLPVSSTPMPVGSPLGDPPPGFVSFCMRYEDQCLSPAKEPEIIPLDRRIWTMLVAVNIKTNAAIQPLDDKSHFDRSEYWTIPTDGYGNCKDYVLTKRKLLAAAGLPRRALRITIATTPQEVRHAVLTVATDRGDFILDNLTDRIKPWRQVPYRWIARQSAAGNWEWVNLEIQAKPGNAARNRERER